MADVTIEITPQTKEFLRVLIRAGKFGKTEKEILERQANEKMFLLPDVRNSLITGYILEGRGKNWIINHLLGNRGVLGRAYEDVRTTWYMHSEEPLPEESKEE
jgi:hypothetical protein